MPVVAADVPKGGIWKICYCATYDGCDAASDFTVEAGLFTVAGANGIGDYHCVKLAPMCGINVDGTSLLAADRIQVTESARAHRYCLRGTAAQLPKSYCLRKQVHIKHVYFSAVQF